MRLNHRSARERLTIGSAWIFRSFLRFLRRASICSLREHRRKRINAVGTEPFMEAGVYVAPQVYRSRYLPVHRLYTMPAYFRLSSGIEADVHYKYSWLGSLTEGRAQQGKKEEAPTKEERGQQLETRWAFASYRTVDPTAHEIELPGPINRRCLWSGGIAASA